MRNNKLLALLVAMYVVYMLNFFKITYSIAHPYTYFKNPLLFHPIRNAKKPRCMICKFGQVSAWFLAAFILLRQFIKVPMILNKVVFFSVLIISLINLNATLYLIPYFVYEYYYIFK